MKQALILCGGKAERLRPYSYAVSKACMPFLNLPLLSLSWFYLEQLAVSRFLLNVHLFPEQLKQTVKFLSRPQQKSEIFFEEEPLGASGTLYKLKEDLQKTKHFFYINGDSLFFPSSLKKIFAFEEDFLNSSAEGSFFCAPIDSSKAHLLEGGALWCDKKGMLKFAGKEKDLPKEWKGKGLLPFQFSGLALFKSSLLNNLKLGDFHLFSDFINPLLLKKTFRVFNDEKAKILEAGDKLSYIEAVKFCLKFLFEDKENSIKTKKENNISKSTEEAFDFENQAGVIKNILEGCFSRFDPQDQIVGLKNGKTWSKKLKYPLLAPENIKGLDYLKLKGFAVLGSELCFFGESCLKDSILGSQLSWRGSLEKDIVLNFFPSF